MGFFSKLADSLAEARERERLEASARAQRMAPYKRGYDVYPEEVRQYFGTMLRRTYFGKVIRDTLIAAACSELCVLAFRTEAVMFIFIPGLIGIISFFFWIADLSRLYRLLTDRFDLFGAMVTNMRIEEHTTTDSDGTSSTSYTYFVSLNGIECEVPNSEYKKVSLETYCYFIRFPAKYRRNDKYYFYPSDPREAEQRIGQHYPGREIRLWRAPGGNGFLIFFAVLLYFFAIVTCYIGVSADVRSVSGIMRIWIGDWQLIGASCGIIGTALLIMNKYYVNKKAKEELEKLRRKYGDYQ